MTALTACKKLVEAMADCENSEFRNKELRSALHDAKVAIRDGTDAYEESPGPGTRILMVHSRGLTYCITSDEGSGVPSLGCGDIQVGVYKEAAWSTGDESEIMLHGRLEPTDAQIADHSQDRFWGEVARRIPECETGDFPPLAHDEFNEACEKAVRTWRRHNKGGA